MIPIRGYGFLQTRSIQLTLRFEGGFFFMGDLPGCLVLSARDGSDEVEEVLEVSPGEEVEAVEHARLDLLELAFHDVNGFDRLQ
jgi:hypothetical protein